VESGGGLHPEGEDNDESWPVMSGWRVCATLAVAARAAALAPALSSMLRRRRLMKHPAWAVAAAVTTITELAWLSQRITRADAEPEPLVGAVDTVGTVAALALAGQAGDPQVVSAFVVSLVIGSASFQALTASLPAGMLGTTAAGTVATVLSNKQKTLSTWEPVVAAAGSFFVTARALRRAVRLNADRLERSALRRAADRDRLEELRTELAVQHERDAQHRLIHQHALQVLEMVAGEWEVSAENLRAHAARESSYLRAAIDGDGPGTPETGLEDALEGLVAEFAGLGLEVRLRGDVRAPEPDAEQCAALVIAVREALTNVCKHAGVTRAEVCTRSDGAGGVVVTVVDDGAGFDPANASRGLQRDVCAPMAAAGGRADVWSRPGSGTRVSLSAPAR